MPAKDRFLRFLFIFHFLGQLYLRLGSPLNKFLPLCQKTHSKVTPPQKKKKKKKEKKKRVIDNSEIGNRPTAISLLLFTV